MAPGFVGEDCSQRMKFHHLCPEGRGCVGFNSHIVPVQALSTRHILLKPSQDPQCKEKVEKDYLVSCTGTGPFVTWNYKE